MIDLAGSSVYILGGSQTDFSRNWSKEGKGAIALLREALEDGLAGAELTIDELCQLNDENRAALFVGNFIAERYVGQGHLGALLTEVEPRLAGIPSARYEAACASGSVALDAARSRVALGEYDVAVVIGWELMKTVDSKTGGDYLGYAALRESEAKGIEFPFPKLFGRLVDEMLVKYGVDEDLLMRSLSQISCINYANAKRNPNAQTRKWFMDMRQAAARGTKTNARVGGRLAVSDCSQVTDGAAVLVLSSEQYVRERLRDCPRVLGWGHRVAPMSFSAKMRFAKNSDHGLPWTRRTVQDALMRAGIDSVEAIDAIEVHDCFTSSEYAAISAFGITEPGDEWRAIEDGSIAINGSIPMNPSGGLIGCGHPVGASGVRMALDCWKQVVGKAGNYQVRGAKTTAMLNFGGTATTNYCFIIGG